MSKTLPETPDFLEPDERQKLFAAEIEHLEKIRQELEGEESRFEPHDFKAEKAMREIAFFFRRMTGYNCGWVPEEYLKHCSKAGRHKKYHPEDRLFHSQFIELLVKRGSSARQAVFLLTDMIDDKTVVPESLQKEFQDSYREYKALENREDFEDITEAASVLGDMLALKLPPLKQTKTPYDDALKALRELCAKTIGLMKEYHPVIARKDTAYPDLFGCALEWVKADYEDPLDYFFRHPTHETINWADRRYRLAQYLYAIQFFRDHAKS